MGRLFFQMMVSADGRMSGPDGELDWHVVDDDFEAYVDGMLRSIEGIVLGRITYDGLASYWPTATEPEAPLMNHLPKHVVSRSHRELAWANSHLLVGDGVEEVRRLKEHTDGQLGLFASATLAANLADAGLIDEFRILVNPILLGAGRPALPGLAKRQALRLTRRDVLTSGTIHLAYEPV